MANEIKLPNRGLSNLWCVSLAGKNEKDDPLRAMFSNFLRSKTSSISDQFVSTDATALSNELAAMVENNYIQMSGNTSETAFIANSSKLETGNINDCAESGSLLSQRSENSELATYHFFYPTGEAAKPATLIQGIKITNVGSLIAEKINNITEIQNHSDGAKIQADDSLKLEPASLHNNADIVLPLANELLPIYDFIDDGTAHINEEADDALKLELASLHSSADIVLPLANELLPIYDFIDDRNAPINEEADEQNCRDIFIEYSWLTENRLADKIVFSPLEEIKLNNFANAYQNAELSKSPPDFFSHQNLAMTVGRAPIADLIYETQILVEARYQGELFKSLSASGEINSKGQMGSSQLETSGSNLKNNNSLELISYGKHLSLTKYLDFSTFEASLTVLPKFNFTEQNLYASPGHLSRTLIDGKNDKSIASVVELFVGKGTEITTSDNKSTSSSTKGKVIRVDVLKKTWEHQVVSKLVSGIKDNTSSIDLILHPKKLGEVSVQIFSDENNVNIKLTSESQSVANLFKTTENQLETLLSQNGMKLAGFTVGYDSQGRDSNRNSPQSNNSKNSILSKKKSEKLVQKDLKTESIAMNRHVGDYDYLV